MLLGLRMPWPEPIGLPAGITLVRAGLFESAGDDRVVGRVAQHLKAVGDEPLGRFQRGDRIGQQRALVGEHFELHPIGAGVFEAEQNLAAQAGDADRVIGVEAAGRVGQESCSGWCR